MKKAFSSYIRFSSTGSQYRQLYAEYADKMGLELNDASVENENADTIRLIYELSAAGLSARQIVEEISRRNEGI
jgi:hypothetical protein